MKSVQERGTSKRLFSFNRIIRGEEQQPMNRGTGYITYCSILICFILLLPYVGFSEMVKGQDGVWSNAPYPQNSITKSNQQNQKREASVSKDGLTLTTDEVTEQCISHYRNNIRKTTECVLRSSNILIEKNILKNCTRPWDHDLNKALSCYNSEVGLSRDDQIEARINFKNESLEMVQKGLKACINGHHYGSSSYQKCIDHWAKIKDDMWENYVMTSES